MKICNFCGKSEKDVKRMITANDADICNECVILCMEHLIHGLEEYKNIEFVKQDGGEQNV